DGHSRSDLNAASRTLMRKVIQHVVEGDFVDWRFKTPESRAQMACLSAEQEAAYRAPTSVKVETGSGRRITTRDEQGLGLLWVTKIGGPSHGFDMLSQCLFPLLANARNSA